MDICHDVLTRQKSRSEVFQLKGEKTEMRITPYFIKEKILQGLTITLQRAP
ncbi:hypothetical protein [Ponticoccus sp. (in: a-proteobacteria)]|uniref:hypothetical protein n=1 Tax=Ponticoccus sp. (in: a-proteobacteria) TaxID=1925025 RepID=UPI003AB7EE8E